MYFEELEKQAKQINIYAEDFYKQNRRIIISLNRIYNITYKSSANNSRSIKYFIDKYNRFIKKTYDEYLDCANEILEYTRNSNQNFEELTNYVSKITDNINSSTSKVDNN